MKLEQVLTHWNAIFFQLVYCSIIYRSVCLFLYIKLELELYPSPPTPAEFANEDFHL